MWTRSPSVPPLGWGLKGNATMDYYDPFDCEIGPEEDPRCAMSDAWDEVFADEMAQPSPAGPSAPVVLEEEDLPF